MTDAVRVILSSFNAKIDFGAYREAGEHEVSTHYLLPVDESKPFTPSDLMSWPIEARREVMRLQVENEELKADKKRLDWLEEQYGIGLIHDDDSQWAVAGNGFQNVRIDKEGPLESTFFVEENEFSDSARGAIDKIMAEETP